MLGNSRKASARAARETVVGTNIRYLDKLIDEIAKGRPVEKVLRG
jgi:hypothetical protein